MTDPGTPTIVRFGEFELDSTRGLLCRAGVVLKLQPQPFRVLQILLDRAPRIVSREEMAELIWGSAVHVDIEQSINFCVRQIRSVLNDSASNPRFIGTLPKQGYRFLAEVVRDQATTAHVAHETFGYAANLLPPNGERDQSGSSAEQSPASIPAVVRRRPGWIVASATSLAILILCLVGVWVYGAASGRHLLERDLPPEGSISRTMQVTPLNNLPGAPRFPAISPDGRQVAFLWNGNTPAAANIYVQLVSGGEPLQITHSRGGEICCADWSRDANQIAFGRCDDQGGSVYIIPALGGQERKVSDVPCPYGIAGFPKWTSDGQSLLLTDRCRPDASVGIVLVSLTTGQRRCLDAPAATDVGDSSPAISPDGKAVAFLRSSTVDSGNLFSVDLTGANLRQLTFDGGSFGTVMWSSDGARVIFDSHHNGVSRAWEMPKDGGPITPMLLYPRLGSLSQDGSRLAFDDYTRYSETSSVWRAEFSGASWRMASRTKILPPPQGYRAPQLSPDAQHIVYQSVDGRIVRSDAEGKDPLVLASFHKGFAGTPRWSPDGKWVVFDYHNDVHSQIYIVDAEGRNLRAMTAGNYEDVVPSWSRDGSRIYYASNRTGSWQVWSHEVASYQEKQITSNGGFAAFESYDRKTLYFSKLDGGGIWSICMGGSSEHHLTDAPHRGYWGDFDVTDSGLFFVDAFCHTRPYCSLL